jgi:hypothetical protein
MDGNITEQSDDTGKRRAPWPDDYEHRALIAWNNTARALFDAGDQQAAAVLIWSMFQFMSSHGWERILGTGGTADRFRRV